MGEKQDACASLVREDSSPSKARASLTIFASAFAIQAWFHSTCGTGRHPKVSSRPGEYGTHECSREGLRGSRYKGYPVATAKKRLKGIRASHLFGRIPVVTEGLKGIAWAPISVYGTGAGTE